MFFIGIYSRNGLSPFGTKPFIELIWNLEGADALPFSVLNCALNKEMARRRMAQAISLLNADKDLNMMRAGYSSCDP